MRASVRVYLAIYSAALAAGSTVALLAFGLPLAAGGGLGPAGVGLVGLAVGLVVLALSVALLFRGIGRPVDRLLAAAARLGAGDGAPSGDLPLLGEPGGEGRHDLSRAAIAFERAVGALGDERARLAAKIDELTAANRALAEARETLLRAEKLATVGRLAAGLAHEVGNPLGAVKGYVDLARARLPPQPNPDLVDALARIEAAANRIDRTLRDLLDFARTTPPSLLPIDVAKVVDVALRLARVQSRFRRVEVAVDLAPDLPPVLADEHHLGQVLLNLFLNAGDAMGGEGHVRVTAGRGEDGAVVVAVEDSGPGIAPDDLPRVFDPFFTTKDPGQGTGLGLAISHRIMESFGGEIVAGNAAGGGARFELRFPAFSVARP